MSTSIRPIDSSILSYLKSAEEPTDARSIAESIDYSLSYTRSRANLLVDMDMLGKVYGSRVIANDVPSREEPVVLSNRSVCLSVIKENRPDVYDSAKSWSLKQLRDFIENQISTNRFPFPNRRVEYYHDPESHSDLT